MKKKYYVWGLVVLLLLAGKCAYTLFFKKDKQQTMETVSVLDTDDALEAYDKKLAEYGGSDSSCEYFLYDITRNGTPDLWICSGEFEAERELHVFTYEADGTLRWLGDSPADHSSFYAGENYVVQHGAHMGCEWLIKYSYIDNHLRADIIYEEEDVREYRTPTELPIELFTWSKQER